MKSRHETLDPDKVRETRPEASKVNEHMRLTRCPQLGQTCVPRAALTDHIFHDSDRPPGRPWSALALCKAEFLVPRPASCKNKARPAMAYVTATLPMTCHQTECTTAVWSKERARPFLIPCSATVLSLWTTTLWPLRSLAKVERPRRQPYPSTSTRGTRAATDTHHMQLRASPAKLSGCRP